MKSLLGGAAILAAMIVPAHAEGIKFKPYLGFDLQRMNLSYDNNLDKALDDGLNGGNVHAGIKFNDYFGLELGYFRTQKGKQDVNFDLSGITGTPGDTVTSTTVRAQGVTLDALAYLPLSDQIDLIGTAGISWTKADLGITGTAFGTAGSIEDDDNEFGYRIGAGAQFNITEQINLRGLIRYQDMGFKVSGFDAVDGAWVYSVGLNYEF